VILETGALRRRGQRGFLRAATLWADVTDCALLSAIPDVIADRWRTSSDSPETLFQSLGAAVTSSPAIIISLSRLILFIDSDFSH
jgi:hypothetical protein